MLNRLELQPPGGLYLFEPYAKVPLPGLLAFIHARNEGAAFSLLSSQPVVLTVLAAALAVAILVWVFRFLPRQALWPRLALGLIFGGALGNLFDRIFRDFQVTDFILVLLNYRGHYWPTFNVADIAICVGIGLFFLLSFLDPSLKEAVVKKEKETA